MPAPFASVEKFLLQFCSSSSSPLLLALSGGPDSLYLFYALLFFRKQHGISFHVAHVDHRWREESQAEAKALEQLAWEYQVPYHLKVLNPSLLKGNLEAACRHERYAFFNQLVEQFSFQALLTGHHQDDQSETVFKRLLEGAHWSRWAGLRPESSLKGMRILRPLIDMGKREIQQVLLNQNIVAFEDPSNQHLQFLRARLRETIFPRLNQEFGKQIQKSLVMVGQEAQELIDYFDERLTPLLKETVWGPLGIYLDLQSCMPKSLLEIKYLLRLLCGQVGFFLSREIIEQAACALQRGQANRLFAMGFHLIRIDRQRIFIPSSLQDSVKEELKALPVVPGHGMLGNWIFRVSEAVYTSSAEMTSWKEGWRGQLTSYLPMGNYQMGFKLSLQNAKIKNTGITLRFPLSSIPHFPLFGKKRKFAMNF